MTSFHGDEDEMGTTDHGLSIDEVDRLLDGRLPAGRDDLAGWAADLASLSAAFDRGVDPVDVRRWATEAAALAGLTPTDNGDLAATSGSNAYRPASQVAGLPKRRISVLNSIAAFLATTLGKVAAAGALVAATTTGGLAATGNLPGQSEAPHPASVEGGTADPGVLDAGGLDEDDEDDGSCALPTSADATVCEDDDVDDDVDDAADDACAGDVIVSAIDASAGDDADDLGDDADDDATDDDDEDCEGDDPESDDAVDVDDQEADDRDDDADEVESDDEVGDDDSSDDDSSSDDDDSSSDDDSSDEDSSDDDADEGTEVPQG
jgi:hypothetical protein